MERIRKYRRIAVFGGVYNNYLALEATLEDARKRAVEAVFCLGDMGGFGPYPDRVFPLLKAAGVLAIQGNYDEALALGKGDCGCGYTDPRDNSFARVRYEYTFQKTSTTNKAWLGTLPEHRRIRLGALRVLMCHGSPRTINEFSWESSTPNGLVEKFRASSGPMSFCAHTPASNGTVRWARASIW
jgi:predicted phosphodiesterase